MHVSMHRDNIVWIEREINEQLFEFQRSEARLISSKKKIPVRFSGRFRVESSGELTVIYHRTRSLTALEYVPTHIRFEL